jgi:hypothetical protein
MIARSSRVLCAVLLIAVGSLAIPRPARAAGDPLFAPIAALKRAFNANDDKAIQALFVPDGVVFDEVTPYRWTGPTAALQWLRADAAVINRNGVKDAQITIGNPTFLHRSVAGAYIVCPLVDSYIVAGRKQRETGLFLFILVKRGAAWKIGLLGFTKQSDTSDRSWL